MLSFNFVVLKNYPAEVDVFCRNAFNLGKMVKKIRAGTRLSSKESALKTTGQRPAMVFALYYFI